MRLLSAIARCGHQRLICFLPPPNPAERRAGKLGAGCCVECVGRRSRRFQLMRLSPWLSVGMAGTSVLRATSGTSEVPRWASGRLGQVSGLVSQWPSTPHTARFHPALRLRIEQLRPPCLESFREDIIVDFLLPTSLKVKGPLPVAQRLHSPAPRHPQQSRSDGHAHAPSPSGSFSSPNNNGRLPHTFVLTPGANCGSGANLSG